MMDARIDAMIADIDARVARQVREIRRHPDFRTMRHRWHALHRLVQRTNFRENVKIELLNCSAEDLLMDFEDSPEIPKSGLYKITYSAEYGPFGGKPYGIILTDYTFGPGPQDVALLQNCAAVAAMAALVFVASATDLLAEEGNPPMRANFDAFRESHDARFVGLVTPRSRGYAVAAFGACVARSFALWRLAANISGPECGRVEGLIKGSAGRGPLDEDRAAALASRGFIPISTDPETGDCLVHAAPSCQAPTAELPSGLDAADAHVGRLLPAVFFITRFAQYLKVLQREQIASWKEREVLERGLAQYLEAYVMDEGAVLSITGERLRNRVKERPDDAASRAVFHDYLSERRMEGSLHSRMQRPLREVRLDVHDVPGHAGWFSFELRVQPNWGYDGRFFTLTLLGKLDKE